MERNSPVDTISSRKPVSSPAGACLPVVFRLDETGRSEISRVGHFALVIFTGGSAVIRTAVSRSSIIAPGAWCFGENERQEIESSHGIRGIGVFFSPSIINDSLNYGNIREGRESLSPTERQDRDFLMPFIERSLDYSGCIAMGPAMLDRAVSLITLLGNELHARSDGFWPCRSRSYLLELLFLLFKLYMSGPAGPVQEIDDSLTGRVIRFMHCSFTEKILLRDLCRRFGTNKTSLNRLIRKATGSTVTEYLNRLRVQSACLLLRDTGLPVLEIAYRAGFNDIVHFGRMFKKHTGSTPRRYREVYRR